MGKMVRPGGKLLTIIFPVGEFPNGPPPHRVTIEQMRDILERNGFVNVFLEPIPAELSEKDRKDFEHLGVWEKK